MIVVKYKYIPQKQDYEEIRRFENVTAEKVLTECATDLPIEQGKIPAFLYEAGEFINNSFLPTAIWHSENGNLFD